MWTLGAGAAGCLVSIYSVLVCAGLCTKQRENSERLLNSHLCRFFSAVHQIHSLPCSVPWRPTLPTAAPSSLATCLLEGPGRRPEGRKRERLASFMVVPWWFPSLSPKPPVPRLPPSVPSGGIVASHCCWPRGPQLQPTSVNGPSVECSPSAPSGVSSVFCWHSYGYT